MQILFRLIRERKGLFAGNLGLRVLKDILPFAGPVLIGIAVDLLSGTERSLLGFDLVPNDVRSIVIVAIGMGVLAVVKVIFGYLHTLVSAHMGRHVVEAARRDLAEAAMQMSLDRRRAFNSGDLLDRSLADTKGLRGFIEDVVIRIISNTVRAVLPLWLMFSIDPLMAVVVLAVIPLQSGFSGILQRRLQRQTRDARAREAEHTSSVKEAIDGWGSVASVSGQEWVASELKATASASEDAKIIKKRTTAAISAVIDLCTAVGIAACYGIGGWRIIQSGALEGSGQVAAGALTLGTLTTFIGVAKKTYAPFQAYTKIVSSYREGLVNLERIGEVLETPMVDQRPNGPRLSVTDGTITLTGVSFTYNEGDTPTLRSLTGSIPGKSLTVITGSSGAGKTTLLRLLMGLDVPDTGTITIDGQDINVAQLKSVQQAIALVPQEPMLFSGTLAENLLLGLSDVSTDELLSACDRAGLLEVVRQLRDGLGTRVGSGRHDFSGGQLRRMAIARALLRRPAILLLDEPTAGLGDIHGAQVLETLREIGKHTTVIMVSHRKAPLAASDHHLILHDGGWSRGATHAERHGAGRHTDGSTSDDSKGFDSAVAGTNGHATSIGNGRPTNGANGNGRPTNGHSTNGGNGNGAQVGGKIVPTSMYRSTASEDVIGLSAMGRPISIRSIDTNNARTRVIMVGGHRADMGRASGFLPRFLASMAAEAHGTLSEAAERAEVAVAGIEDLNPDGPWVPMRKTALGVDLASDHRERLAVETRLFHAALDAWETDLIIDVAETDRTSPTGADVEVIFHYLPESDGSVPERASRTALEIGHELRQLPFTAHVALTPGLPESVTAVKGIQLIELTATTWPSPSNERRSLEALVATAMAAFGSVSAADGSSVNA